MTAIAPARETMSEFFLGGAVGIQGWVGRYNHTSGEVWSHLIDLNIEDEDRSAENVDVHRRDVDTTPAGGVVAAGYSSYTEEHYNLWLASYDAEGQGGMLETDKIGGFDAASAIAVDNLTGDIVVMGVVSD